MPKSRYANVKRNSKAKKKDADQSWTAPAMWSDDRYKIVKSAFDAVDEVAKKTSHGKSLDAAKRFTVAKSKIPHPWRDGGLTLSLRFSVSRMYCRLRVSASD